jgi:periplasmic nitrate reductase NapD
MIMRNSSQPDLSRRAFLLRDRAPEVHIASCVVRVWPDRVPAASPQIESVIGCAISGNNGNGKLVVVLEGASTGALLDQMERIRAINGVLGIEMVYQHAEAETEMKEQVK